MDDTAQLINKASIVPDGHVASSVTDLGILM